MWFLLAVAALLCWSFSDLFSKIGCVGHADSYAPLKMITAVGTVMGLHAAYELVWGGVSISGTTLLTYLPVSALYIGSMAIGYFGLQYIELAISSPICNASGALVALVTLLVLGPGSVNGFQIAALLLVCAGVIGLGFVEAGEDEALRMKRQADGHRYNKSIWAILLPVLYCILDAAGTFGDNRVLEHLEEDSANVAYELTFFACGLAAFIYVALISKQRFRLKEEVPKYVGAVFETAGQFAYIYAIADTSHLMLSAPVISSYCLVSVIWGRLFLKEKLSRKHYGMIALTVIGIAVLGLFDELG